MQESTREGLLYGLAAYIWWGLVPLYFRWLEFDEPLDFVAHRIAWSAVFLALLLTIFRRWPEMIRCLTTPRLLLPLCASALLVAVNWLFYVVCVHNKVIVQASLGYFILPLVNITLGMAIFRERLRPLQYVAIAVALVGVISLTAAVNEFPWLAIGVAVSFSIYGLIRKQVPVDGLVGLTVETIVLLPIVLTYLAVGYLERMEMKEPWLLFKLSLSGVVTAVPLLCFGQAARKLPFSTLGFMQYISPSLQFCLAVSLFHEEVRGGWTSYAIVWAALVIFSIDSYRRYRVREQPA